MNKSNGVENKLSVETIWDYYGLTDQQWVQLMPIERLIHYNRKNVCEHKANLQEWPFDLREALSHDPYFNTAHMIQCQRPRVSIDECACQMCLLKIGVPR